MSGDLGTDVFWDWHYPRSFFHSWGTLPDWCSCLQHPCRYVVRSIGLRCVHGGKHVNVLSSLQRKFSGKLSGHRMLWKSSSFNGVCELLKHVAKNVFRSSAFSSLDCATLVPICKAGIEVDDPLSILQAFQNSFGLHGLIFLKNSF